MASEFEFVPPPEAPVFRPTEEEFADPLGYINKIRPIAEQTGIARIVPPPDWQPPFAVDVDNLKFTPRIQRLNELEAHTRVKLNFLDQIAKFWELQGSSLRIPLVEGKALDLHALHCEVHKEGGPDVVSLNRRWNKIAHRMGFPTAKHHLSFTLKHHYDKILLPYDIFKRAQACGEVESGEAPEPAPEPRPAEDTGKKMAGGTRRVNRPQETTLDHDAVQELADQGGNNKELKRLQFYGAGPKMSGYQESVKSKAPRAKKILYEADPLARYVCHTCTKGDSEESMLLCDGCDDSYHTFCLNPPLAEIPKGDWRCPQCVAAEVEKPQEAFGFEQAQKEYTLQTFGEMADQFKADYFNMPVHMIPTQTVEREFWRVVSSIDEDVCVEYGADLHTMDHGSGFPTAQSKNLSPEDQVYVDSGWNLNNIAVLDDSILAHIKANISGMKVPWMYVGMCFSTFCWHNEDHWSYSINYLHWGEPKTWYGVSGLRATQFEAAMTAAAPELFKAQPDLLHQLVTTMNPNVLMAAGVPIFRTDQHAGEFVITLPRAYHTGFNQGFNFAEAVNFAPPDWLSIGRECVAHYSQLRRFCVFSHDELVCSMALEPDRLSLLVASATYQNMLRLIETERQGRTQMLEKGVRRAEREAFELLQDDERQCDYCKTTCFLSAITCPCSKRLVCLRHYDKLCECPPANHILRYRYTLQELPEMLNGLKVRVESFDRWIQRVKEGLEATGDDRLDLEELKALLQEAEAKRFPESDLISSLALVVEEATKCSLVAQQLTSNKVRTRTRQQGEAKHRLTVDELQLFHEHISQLACRVPEQDDVGRLVQQVQQFQRRACQLVEPELPPPAADIQACVDMGAGLDIELPEIAELRQRLSHAEWMEEVEEAVEGRRRLSVDGLQKLVETGVTLPPYHVVERAMSELQSIVQNGQQLEERARAALDASPVQSLPEIEALLREAEKVPATLPNVESLEEAVKKAQAWMERVVALTDKKEHPRLEVIEAMVARGQPMPVLLPDLSRLESLVNNAKTWRERTARTFLKRSSASVLDVLTPRTEQNLQQPRRKRRPKEGHPLGAGVDGEDATVAQVVDAYRAAEARELELVRELRAKNRQKRETEAADAKYCLCRQPLRGQMLQCQLCCDYFHASCVKNMGMKRDSSASGGGGLKQESAPPPPPPPDAHFLCPACQRTRRPRLEVVLSLLLTLQKLSVRMPEGIALQCLTERAMSWQDRARQVLTREDMVHNLAVLAAQREAAGREKPLGRPPGPARDRSAESSAGLDHDSDSSRESPALHIKREASLEHSSFSSSEHAYSSAFKPAPTTAARRPRKSILSPRHTEAPPLPPGAVLRPLAAEAVALLESVLMEGDLLEVRLEEVGQLWSLLSAARPQAAADMTFPDIDIVKMEGRKPGTPGAGSARKKRAPPGTDSPRGSQPPKRLKVKVKPAEQRGSREPGTPSPAPRSASASPSPARRAPKPAAASFKRKPAGKAKKMVSDGKGRRAPKQRSASQDSDGPLSNYVEDCAATPCQKPHGSCINWIGCDDCEQWYHYICVGLPKNYQVTEDMVYICPRCQDTQSGPRAGSSSGLLDLAAAAEEEDGANALLSLAAGGLASGAPPSAQPPRKSRPGRSGDESLSDDSADEE